MIITFDRDTLENLEIYNTDDVLPSFSTNLRNFIRVPNNLKGLALLSVDRKTLSLKKGYLEQSDAPLFTFKEIQDHLVKVYTKTLSSEVPSNTAFVIDLVRLFLEGESNGISISYPVVIPSSSDGSEILCNSREDLLLAYKNLLVVRLGEAKILSETFSDKGRKILSAKNQVELNSIGV